MPTFQYPCPNCSKPTTITPPGACSNMRGGHPCGFTLPCQTGIPTTTSGREKYVKHTSPPIPGCNKVHSWTEDASNYVHFQRATAISGSVNFDPHPYNHPDNPSLFLFSAPRGPSEIARIKYPGVPDVAASGCIMPLNSRLANIHHFYGNYSPHFIPIAEGENIIIQRPQSNFFKVMQNGELLFEFDSISKVWNF